MLCPQKKNVRWSPTIRNEPISSPQNQNSLRHSDSMEKPKDMLSILSLFVHKAMLNEACSRQILEQGCLSVSLENYNNKLYNYFA